MSKVSRTSVVTATVSLAEAQIQLLPTSQARARARRLLAKHHYLGDVRAEGDLYIHGMLGSEEVRTPVEVGAEADAFVGDLAESTQGEDLEAA